MQYDWRKNLQVLGSLRCRQAEVQLLDMKQKYTWLSFSYNFWNAETKGLLSKTSKLTVSIFVFKVPLNICARMHVRGI